MLTLNSHALLKRVPSLPRDLPKVQNIIGQLLWRVLCPELPNTLDNTK